MKRKGSWRRLAFALGAAAVLAAGAGPERRQIGDLLLEDIPPEAEATGRAVADFVDARRSYKFLSWRIGASGHTFLRSGDLYAADAPDGAFTRIVDLPQRIEDPRPALVCGRPGFVFAHDERDDEYDVVFAASARRDGFNALPISPPDSRNATLRVSLSGALVAYASAGRGTGIWQLIAQAPCAGDERRVLEHSTYRIYVEDIAPGDRILVTRQDDDGHLLYAVDAETGAVQTLVRSEQPVRQAFAARGRVLFTTNAWSEFVELYAVAPNGGAPVRVVSGLDWDIERIALSADRRRLAVIVNENGLSRVLVIDADTGATLGGGLSAPLGVIDEAAFTHDGVRIALTLNRDAGPEETGLYDWTSGAFERWSGGVEPASAGRVSRPINFSYPSAPGSDGAALAIPALMHLPANASVETPAPVVIVAHGGPASQWRPEFSRLYNYYVMELGVAVIMPNIRGSSGYGRSFEQADDGVRRRNAIADIGALLDWIEADQRLDADRVVISGGSYGGFVALASAAEYPQRLRGAISRVGVTDIATFLANTEPYRVANRRLEYGDERDPVTAAELERVSPLRRAGEILAPVLIMQGGADPRVPRQQAESMVAAVRANGRPAGYLLAADEGHSFEDPVSRRWRDGAQVEFIRRHLLEANSE